VAQVAGHPSPKRTLPIRGIVLTKPDGAPESPSAAAGAHARAGMTEAQRWDSYFEPGTDIMRNMLTKPGEARVLPKWVAVPNLEEQLSLRRMTELAVHPIDGNFNLEHMQRIHQFVLGGIYDWAGTVRDVNMNKKGHSYAPYHQIVTIWAAQHKELVEDRMLTRITDPAVFAHHLARHWGAVNTAHAFREGNTRTQAVFFHQLAAQAGWDLDVTRLNPKHEQSLQREFVEARFYHQENEGDSGPLANVLVKAVTRRDAGLEFAAETAAEPELAAEPKEFSAADLEDRYRRNPELRPVTASVAPTGHDLEFE